MSIASTGSGVGLRAILGVRGFRLLLGSRLTGQLGDGLVQSSLATFVLFSPERQPTATRVALAFAILLLPYSLVGPFAGVLIDRWWRRTILVRANLLRALLVVGLAAVVFSGRDDWVLAVAVLVVLGVNRFILASLSAGLPHVVADRYLVTGNALAPTAGTVAAVIGGLAGVAIRSAAGGGDVGSVVVLGCAIAAYVVASLVATRLRPAELGPDDDTEAESVRGVARGMVDGLRHLRERRPAARAIGLVMVHRVIFGIAVALAVLQVRGVLHPDDSEAAIGALTLTTAAAGFGAFLGAVSTPRASRRFGAVRWSAGALVAGVTLGAIGVATGTPARAARRGPVRGLRRPGGQGLLRHDRAGGRRRRPPRPRLLALRRRRQHRHRRRPHRRGLRRTRRRPIGVRGRVDGGARRRRRLVGPDRGTARPRTVVRRQP